MKGKVIYSRLIASAGSNGYHSYRIPAMLALRDGSLLLAFEARAENKGDWGDIDIVVLRFQKDGAMHECFKYGSSHLPADGSMRTYNNPTLVPDGDSVHLIFHKNYSSVYQTTSQDKGITWDAPHDITCFYRLFPYEWNVSATGPGHGIQMDSGRLVMPVWLAKGAVNSAGIRDHFPSVAGCVYSDDHGKTWCPGFLTDESAMKNASETTVAQLPDKRLLFNFRNEDPSYRRVLGISNDGLALNTCWRAEQLPDPVCCGAQVSYSNGVLFSNCSCEMHCAGQFGWRNNLTVKHTAVDGSCWETLCMIDQYGGYSDIAWSWNRAYVFYEKRCEKSNQPTELDLAEIVFTDA